MVKVVFLGGLRGVGKTTLLNHFKNLSRFDFYDLIKEAYKSENRWPNIESRIGQQIKNIANKKGIVLVALHYAVPYESAMKDIKKGVMRDYSEKYHCCLTETIINNMASEKIVFLFFYLSVPITLLKKRLNLDFKENPQRVSLDYFKNINKIKREDYSKFNETINKFKIRKLKIKNFYIHNDKDINFTYSRLKKLIWEN